MRIGVGFSSGGLTPGEIVECVRLAEELGYESAWMTEGHAGDQFAILGACAVATKRITLGTAISSVFVRSAPTIAMAAATVDHLSGGRMILGLGSSHKVQVEGEHGIPFGDAIPRVRDTVAVVRALLRDGVVAHHGEAIDIERFELWFTPLRAHMPIYLAALFPKMRATAFRKQPEPHTCRRCVSRRRFFAFPTPFHREGGGSGRAAEQWQCPHRQEFPR